jgi:hypothetical protein
MKNYNTLLEAINGLKKEGYIEDCQANGYKLFHDEFVVDKYFRFEDDTDPANQSIIYAIYSEKYGLKGMLVNSYGIYSDPLLLSHATNDKII